MRAPGRFEYKSETVAVSANLWITYSSQRLQTSVQLFGKRLRISGKTKWLVFTVLAAISRAVGSALRRRPSAHAYKQKTAWYAI